MSIPLFTTGYFACLALRARVSHGLPRTSKLEDGVYVATEMPFEIDDFWKEHIGKIESEHIERCTLFILAQTEYPAISSDELLDLVNTCYYSLLLQGVGYCKGGVVLYGPNTSAGRRVKGFGRHPDYYEPHKVLSADVADYHLSAASALCRGFDTIYQVRTGAVHQAPAYLRLRKGFHAFLDAIKQEGVHERLHQFVRAIEAVIRPKQGDGTKQFKYRCQLFIGRTSADAELLEELYELRCAVEHLNPMSDKLSKYPAHEHDDVKSLRAYQAELLAGFVYRKILTTPSIVSVFESEQNVTILWQKRTGDLVTFWGDTINLHKAWEGRFHDYL